jgi:transcriptional regulator with XRE-family HTH domain
MVSESERLRSILSLNIKKRRKTLAFSQEGLAEAAELSAQTINDIEGRRMWVSDKIMAKLARALQVEAYQLLVPVSEPREESSLLSPREVFHALQRSIKIEIDHQFEEALKKGILG